MKDPDLCPTCMSWRRKGRYINTMTRKKAMILVRKGKAELAGTNKVGMGYERVAFGEGTKRGYFRGVSPSKSYVRCLDDFHLLPEPPCQDKCTQHPEIPHWHGDDVGRGACAWVCVDPEDETPYFTATHYHLRSDLPRQHDAGKASRKIRRNLTRQAKSKR